MKVRTKEINAPRTVALSDNSVERGSGLNGSSACNYLQTSHFHRNDAKNITKQCRYQLASPQPT